MDEKEWRVYLGNMRSGGGAELLLSCPFLRSDSSIEPKLWGPLIRMAFGTVVALYIALKPGWDTSHQLINQTNSKA